MGSAGLAIHWSWGGCGAVTVRQTKSRLARSLGPLGVIGSLLLHGAVLAALLDRPTVPHAPQAPEPRMVFSVAFASVDTRPPEPAPPSPAAESAPPETVPAVDTPSPEPPPHPTPPDAPVVASLPPIAASAQPQRSTPKSAQKPDQKTAQKPKPTPKPTPAAPDTAAPAETVPALSDAASAPPQSAAAAPAVAPDPGPPPAPVRLSTVRARVGNPPAYPDRARRDELEGTVALKLVVSPTGQVEEVLLLRSSGHRILDDAARRAVWGWQLYPAERDGTPVAGWAEVEIPFRLTD